MRARSEDCRQHALFPTGSDHGVSEHLRVRPNQRALPNLAGDLVAGQAELMKLVKRDEPELKTAVIEDPRIVG